MNRDVSLSRVVRIVMTIGFLFVLASCGGNGCSCVTPIPGGFPKDQRHENMIQARLTRGGLNFIEQNASGIINGALPGGNMSMPGVFKIPPSGCPGGSTRLCCPEDNPKPRCGELKIDLIPADTPMVLTTTDPNILAFRLRARLKTLEDIRFHASTGIVSPTCNLQLDTTKSGTPYVELVGNATFTIHDPGSPKSNLDNTRVDVTGLTINNLETGDIDISGGFTCTLADVFLGAFIGTLRDQLTKQINDAIKDGLCQKCESGMVSECAPWGDACTDKICMRGGKCIQKLGVDGRMDVGAMFGSFSPGMSAPMDLSDVAGHYAKVQSGSTGGLSLGINAGNHAPVHDTCVPVRTAAAITPVTESPVFQMNSHADAPYPFHLGIGIHEQFLTNGGFAVYDAGGLCLNVGTRSVDLLASDTFTVLIGSLKDLTHGQKSPLILSLRPQNPPTMLLGAGTIMVDPVTMEKKIVDPLITVGLDDLDIDFQMMVDERYIRIFTLTADVTLPIALDIDAMGKIVPLIGETDMAFKDVRVKGSDLLAETSDEIAAKFPTILALALPFLSSSLSGFALPDFMGMKLVVAPGGIKRVDGKYLGIFATLDKAMPAASPVETTATLARLDLPQQFVFEVKTAADVAAAPKATIQLGGAGFDGTARSLEWSYRVDGGFWSIYTDRPELVLAKPEFLIQGRHLVEVRAREQGAPTTLDETPARVELLIDTMAPVVKLVPDSENDQLVVDARDLVTPAGKLAYAVRLRDGDAFGGWSFEAPFIDLRTVDPDAVMVRVRDEAGNVGEVSGAAAFHGRAPKSAGGCGCTVATRETSRTPFVLALALFGLLFARAGRRLRRGRLGLMLLGALALGAFVMGCGGSDGGGGDYEPGGSVRGATGRFSDLAASDKRVVASGYESAFGDLVIIERREGGTLRVTPADGVPLDGVSTLNPKGYRAGIEDPGENVGHYTSIVLDENDDVRVAYQDVGQKSLKFAIEPSEGGRYTAHVVDAGGATKGEVGRYASLMLDAMGNPVIAYMATGVPDVQGGLMGGFKHQLKVARGKVKIPAAATDWTITVVEESKAQCAGLCGTGNVCVEMTDRCAPEDLTGCTMTCGAGTACVGRACVAVRAAPPAVDIADGPGLWPQLVLSGGKVNVVYYHRFADHGELKLATEAGATWTVSPIDADPMRDRGQFATAASAMDGTIHVVYQDALKDDLYYATVKPGSPASMPELVDDGERTGERPHAIGGSAALILENGVPRVLYQDQFLIDLIAAKRGSGGMWTRSTVESGTAGFGFYTSVASNGSKAYFSNFVYDGTDDPFGRIDIKPLP